MVSLQSLHVSSETIPITRMLLPKAGGPPPTVLPVRMSAIYQYLTVIQGDHASKYYKIPAKIHYPNEGVSGQ